VVLFFLDIALIVTSVVAWFAIVFTLVTDVYPPFRLSD
jgi:hypothetical protein